MESNDPGEIWPIHRKKRLRGLVTVPSGVFTNVTGIAVSWGQTSKSGEACYPTDLL